MTDPTAPPVRMPDPAVREHPAHGTNGFLGLAGGLLLVLGGAALALAPGTTTTSLVLGGLVGAAGLVVLAGLVTVSPGEAEVLPFFGRCTGTVRRAGLRWVDPPTTRRTVSTRIRNHGSDVLEVNDSDGDPIEIESRLTHLAHAPEIAGAMLSEREIVDLDEERAAMVRGPVVLCGDRATQPIVDAGSLY